MATARASKTSADASRIGIGMLGARATELVASGIWFTRISVLRNG
jgi:hypothetical protein